ncbi:MAG: hypothetical protein ACUZ77_02600 [Candidatus Brocadiales bacterium]
MAWINLFIRVNRVDKYEHGQMDLSMPPVKGGNGNGNSAQITADSPSFGRGGLYRQTATGKKTELVNLRSWEVKKFHVRILIFLTSQLLIFPKALNRLTIG